MLGFSTVYTLEASSWIALLGWTNARGDVAPAVASHQSRNFVKLIWVGPADIERLIRLLMRHLGIRIASCCENPFFSPCLILS